MYLVEYLFATTIVDIVNRETEVTELSDFGKKLRSDPYDDMTLDISIMCSSFLFVLMPY